MKNSKNDLVQYRLLRAKETFDRGEYAQVVEENAKRVYQNPDYYRKKQQITEHMFGTLKRQRGFTFTLVRGKENVLGEVGLKFIGYNISRCISVMEAEKLIAALKSCCLLVIRPQYRLVLSNLMGLFSNTDFYLSIDSMNLNADSTSLFNPIKLSLSIK